MIEYFNARKELRGTRNRVVCDTTCESCGETRTISLDNAKQQKTSLCTRCSLKRERPKSGKMKTCKACGRKFYVIPALFRRKVYCSRACAIIKHGAICLQCGKVFTTKHGKFCSRKCFHESMYSRITKTCQTCGQEFQVIRSRIDAQFCSRECYRIDGAKNPNYKDGHTVGGHPHPYGGSWESIRKAIKERDGYTCQHDSPDHSGRLEVHHITKFNPENREQSNSPGNLITYCHKHHTLIHSKHPPEFTP